MDNNMLGSSNMDCVINPLTGRAVKTTSRLGKKIMKDKENQDKKPHTMYKSSNDVKPNRNMNWGDSKVNNLINFRQEKSYRLQLEKLITENENTFKRRKEYRVFEVLPFDDLVVSSEFDYVYISNITSNGASLLHHFGRTQQ